jgi:hypothetical protein
MSCSGYNSDGHYCCEPISYFEKPELVVKDKDKAKADIDELMRLYNLFHRDKSHLSDYFSDEDEIPELIINFDSNKAKIPELDGEPLI